jgi:hypothetical protein
MRQSSSDNVGTVNKQFTVNKQLKTQDYNEDSSGAGNRFTHCAPDQVQEDRPVAFSSSWPEFCRRVRLASA